ncbi:hypothetical protein N9219_01610 [bacterium]|nr:hypothetical protein [bacterium]
MYFHMWGQEVDFLQGEGTVLAVFVTVPGQQVADSGEALQVVQHAI